MQLVVRREWNAENSVAFPEDATPEAIASNAPLADADGNPYYATDDDDK